MPSWWPESRAVNDDDDDDDDEPSLQASRTDGAAHKSNFQCQRHATSGNFPP